MSHVLELQKQRNDAINEMRALIGVAKTEKRHMNGEETKKFDELDKKQAELLQEIAREEKLEGLERSLAQPVYAEQKVVEPSGKSSVSSEQRNKFESFGDYLQAVHRSSYPGAAIDKRLLEIRAASGLNETVPSDGGYLIQKDFLTEVLGKVYDTGILAGRCRRVPVTGNGLKVNAVDETSRATGSRLGGITGYWAGEADQKTASKPKFRQMEMTLQKLVGLCYATDELLQDTASLQSIITEGFASEFGFMLDDAIVNGDGAGKPLGILQSPCLVSVAKEGSQAAATVLTANIVKMRARLWARSRPNAVWLYNQDIEPQLHQLTLGAAGSNLAVYLPGGSLAGQPFDTLMGIPAFPIEQCATLGTQGDLILADLSQYLLIEKGGIAADMSMHVRFIYDESVFRFVLRVNGQPIWNAALTPFKGSNTQSPFITLDTRA